MRFLCQRNYSLARSARERFMWKIQHLDIVRVVSEVIQIDMLIRR